MITLTINGDRREFESPLTISRLLAELDVPRESVAVEVNREIVPRSLHPEHDLCEGDQVEIVTFVGGG